MAHRPAASRGQRGKRGKGERGEGERGGGRTSRSECTRSSVKRRASPATSIAPSSAMVSRAPVFSSTHVPRMKKSFESEAADDRR